MFEERVTPKLAPVKLVKFAPDVSDFDVVERVRVPEWTRTLSKVWTERKRRSLRLLELESGKPV